MPDLPEVPAQTQKRATFKRAKRNAAKAQVDVETDENKEYEVEMILDHKKVGNGPTKYLIKWKGYGEEENTWESKENISAPKLLTDYLKGVRR